MPRVSFQPKSRPEGFAGYSVIVGQNEKYKKESNYRHCDGTMDNVQIQNAITTISGSGGKIHIEEGDYDITSSVIINSPGIYIEGVQGDGTGANTYGTVLQASNAVDIFQLQPWTVAAGLGNVTIKNMGLYGQNYTNTGNLIGNSGFSGTANNIYRLRLQNIEFRYVSSGYCAVNIMNPEGVYMENCYIHALGNKSTGLKLEANGFAAGPVFLNNNRFAVDTSYSGVVLLHIQTTANSFKRVYAYGNTFNASEYDDVTGVLIEGTVQGAGNWHFLSNSFEDCKYGIRSIPTNYNFDLNIGENQFWYRRNPVESGNTQVYLGSNTVMTVVSRNYFEGTNNPPISGSIGIDNDGRPLKGWWNRMENNQFYRTHEPIQTRTGGILLDNRSYQCYFPAETEKIGTATVLSGQTSVTVNLSGQIFHITGSPSDVLLTPTVAPVSGYATYWYWDTPVSGSFNVNIGPVDNRSSFTINYRAVYEP